MILILFFFIDTFVNVLYTAVQKLGVGSLFFFFSYDQKKKYSNNSNFVKYHYILRFFFILIAVMQLFNISVFNVTWSFKNYSNIMILWIFLISVENSHWPQTFEK